MNMFRKATKKQAKARIALVGPSGSGKTYTALRIASALGKRIAVIDTEQGSAEKYADLFSFDTMTPESFEPEVVVDAVHAAADNGYDLLVVDSLSHFWSGTGGALEQVDNATKRSKSGNAFTSGWREVTPRHNKMVDALVRAPLHVIVTMRVKTEWVIEENDRGKKTPRKIGLAPVQRAGLEYEFDIVGDLDDAELVITKTRCPALKGAVIREPGEDFAKTIADWLGDGEPTPDFAAMCKRWESEIAKATTIDRLFEIGEEIKDAAGVPPHLLTTVRSSWSARKEVIETPRDPEAPAPDDDPGTPSPAEGRTNGDTEQPAWWRKEAGKISALANRAGITPEAVKEISMAQFELEPGQLTTPEQMGELYRAVQEAALSDANAG